MDSFLKFNTTIINTKDIKGISIYSDTTILIEFYTSQSIAASYKDAERLLYDFNEAWNKLNKT